MRRAARFAAPLCLGALLQAAGAQPADLADRLIAAYSRLDSYCDSARQPEPPIASLPAGPARLMEHCVLRDGRYKATEGWEGAGRSLAVSFSDGQWVHHYTHSGGDRPFETYSRYRGSQVPSSDIPPLISLVMSWYWLAAADLAHLRSQLNAFDPVPEQSTQDLEVYEAPESDTLSRRRLEIARSDGLIRRISWKDRHGGETAIEVNQVRLNEPVAPAQLTHEVSMSLQLRFEAKNHALELAAAASALSFGAGLVFWRLRWRRPTDREAVLESRRRSWTVYRRVLFWTAPAALLLAFLAPTGGDMSGAALMAMRVAWAVFYVYLLWLIGLFIAARHVVEKT